jgi:hypothetical protein
VDLRRRRLSHPKLHPDSRLPSSRRRTARKAALRPRRCPRTGACSGVDLLPRHQLLVLRMGPRGSHRGLIRHAQGAALPDRPEPTELSGETAWRSLVCDPERVLALMAQGHRTRSTLSQDSQSQASPCGPHFRWASPRRTKCGERWLTQRSCRHARALPSPRGLRPRPHVRAA